MLDHPDTPLDPRLSIGGNHPPSLVEQVAAALPDDTEALRAEIEPLAARANAAPRKIRNDNDLDVVGTVVTDARDLLNRLDVKRKEIGDPYFRTHRRVNEYFKPFTDRVDRIVKTLQGVADAYAAEKAAKERAIAEAQARKAREEEEARLAAAKAAEEAGRLKNAGAHAAKAEAAAEKAAEAEARAHASAADLTRTRTDSGILSTAKEEWDFEIEKYDAIGLEPLRPYLKREAIEQAIRWAIKAGKREIAGVRIFPKTKAQFRR
jgi:hypothetical protein